MPRPAWLDRILGKAPEPTKGTPMTPGTSGISWASGATEGDGLDLRNLVGSTDPMILTPLLPGETVHACTRCKVGYHADTFAFLRDQNNGNCVGCRQRDKFKVVILPGTLPAVAKPAPVPAPAAGDVVRLDKVRDHIGQVVTFEGYVYRAHESRAGTWFVKFEQTRRPFDGFKLVIFNRYVPAWVDANIDPGSYEGQTVRVRGLVQEHPEWGMEIIVYRPDTIEIVDPSKPRTRILWKEDPGF